MDKIENNPNETKNIRDVKFEIPTQIFVLLARRFFGKTVMVQNLLLNLIQSFPIQRIIVISDTAKFTKSYSAFVADSNIYDSEKMDSIINKTLGHQSKKNNKQRRNILIIIDDINLSQVSKPLAKICSQGRHYNIGTIISVQYSKIFLSPVIRNNVDFWFVGEINREPIKELFSSWVTEYDDFPEFYKMFREKIHKPLFLTYNAREHERKDRLQIMTCDLIGDKIKISRGRK